MNVCIHPASQTTVARFSALRLNLEEKTFQLDRCTFLTRPLDRSSILSCIPSGRLRKAANGIKRHRLHVGLSGTSTRFLALFSSVSPFSPQPVSEQSAIPVMLTA